MNPLDQDDKKLNENDDTDRIDNVNLVFCGHKVKGNWIIYLIDMAGNTIELLIDWFWVIFVLDIGNNKVIGYSISLHKKYNKVDIDRAIINALSQSAGNIGSRIKAASVPFPEGRAILEQFLRILEELGFRFLHGSLGTGPGDLRREGVEQDAKVYRVNFDNLRYCLDLSISWYNCHKKKSGLEVFPLQRLEQYIADTNIIEMIHPDKWGKIWMFGLRYVRTVRGSISNGTRPYVQILGERYSNAFLGCRWDLIGKEITVYLQNNAQFADAYDDTGRSLGILCISSFRWNFPHSYETRVLVEKGKKFK